MSEQGKTVTVIAGNGEEYQFAADTWRVRPEDGHLQITRSGGGAGQANSLNDVIVAEFASGWIGIYMAGARQDVESLATT